MFSLFSGMAFLAGSFLFLKLATLYWKRSRLPPGPFPLPLIGNLWQLNFQLHPNMLFQVGAGSQRDSLKGETEELSLGILEAEARIRALSFARLEALSLTYHTCQMWGASRACKIRV